MARIKLGPNIVDIRGKVGEVVYSVWKAGVAYCRKTAAIIANPKSLRQGQVREFVAQYATKWYTTLTAAQRNGWNELAQRLAGLADGSQGGILNMVPKIGGIMSGQNAYIAFNVRAKLSGVAGGDDAPLGEDQPTAPTGVSAVYLAGTLTVTWTEPAIKETGYKVAVWFRSHEKTYHKQSEGAYAISPAAMTQAESAGGVKMLFTVAAPFNSIVQLQTVNPSGWASPGSEAVETSCP